MKISEMKCGDIIIELDNAGSSIVTDSGYIVEMNESRHEIVVYWYNELKELFIRDWMVSVDGKNTKYQWIGNCDDLPKL